MSTCQCASPHCCFSFFVDVDITDNKLAKKIREAQLEQCAPAPAFASVAAFFY